MRIIRYMLPSFCCSFSRVRFQSLSPPGNSTLNSFPLTTKLDIYTRLSLTDREIILCTREETGEKVSPVQTSPPKGQLERSITR